MRQADKMTTVGSRAAGPPARQRWRTIITSSNTTQTATTMLNTVEAAPGRKMSGSPTLPVHQPGGAARPGQIQPWYHMRASHWL